MCAVSREGLLLGAEVRAVGGVLVEQDIEGQSVAYAYTRMRTRTCKKKQVILHAD